MTGQNSLAAALYLKLIYGIYPSAQALYA